MILQKLVNEMEELIPFGESTKTQYSVTGEEYITLAWGSEDLKELLKFYPRFLTNFILNNQWRGENKVLYWRVKPTIRRIMDDLNFDSGGEPKLVKKYSIRCRLMISSKLVLEKK